MRPWERTKPERDARRAKTKAEKDSRKVIRDEKRKQQDWYLQFLRESQESAKQRGIEAAARKIRAEAIFQRLTAEERHDVEFYVYYRFVEALEESDRQRWDSK